MSRRKAAAKRVILPDPMFGSQLVAKFMNIVMESGKKSCAEKIVYGALDKLLERARGKVNVAADASAKGKEVKATKSKTAKISKKTDMVVESTDKGVVLELFSKVLDAIRPSVEVRSRRVGGATYQIPVEVRMERGIALAMRWLVNCASLRSEKTMALRLAAEMFDALENRGGAIKKREDVHRMANANKAFAFYRW